MKHSSLLFGIAQKTSLGWKMKTSFITQLQNLVKSCYFGIIVKKLDNFIFWEGSGN